MFTKKELKLGKIFGIKIALDYSWFWIFLLVTASFVFTLLPASFPDRSAWLYVLAGLFGSSLFFISILIHELAHILVARGYGLKANKISLFVFGGVSELPEEPQSPRTEFYMALAGPFVSFAIAGALFGISQIFLSYNISNPAIFVLGTIGRLNLFLGIFNLLPGFPLDGGRILRSLIWSRSKSLVGATAIAANFGKMIAILLIVFAIVQIYFLNLVGGIWLILISYFLFKLAGASFLQTILLLALKNKKAKDLIDEDAFVLLQKQLEDSLALSGEENNMTALSLEYFKNRMIGKFPSIPEDLPGIEAVKKFNLPSITALAVVNKDDQIIGFITLTGIESMIKRYQERRG